MLYSPRTFFSMKDVANTAILDGRSDTTFDGRDVFGYLDNGSPEAEVIFARDSFDEESGEWFAVADID